LSGEINSTVTDVQAAKDRVHEAFADRAKFDNFDGITVTGNDKDSWWWFNVRASNTEPLLRLNVEARDLAVMQALRDEVLALIRK